jgi:hypothetical protein
VKRTSMLVLRSSMFWVADSGVVVAIDGLLHVDASSRAALQTNAARRSLGGRGI